MAKKKTFEQLKAEWYGKLKRSGFKDIEDDQGRLIAYSSDFHKPPTHDIRLYTIISSNGINELTALARSSSEEYFRLAEHFLNSYDFPSIRHRLVWELHTNGISERRISVQLLKRYPTLTRGKVQTMVGAMRKVMLGGLS